MFVCKDRKQEKARAGGMIAYILLDDRTKTLDPEETGPGNFIHEETLSGKHALREALSLVGLLDPTRGREERILANFPFV